MSRGLSEEQAMGMIVNGFIEPVTRTCRWSTPSSGAASSSSDGRRYRTDSDPITDDGDDVIRLEDLLDALAATQETMRAWLDSVDAAWLAEETPVAPDRAAPRADQIHFGYFHDTYHTGQIDLLRQVAGKNDAVL
jgi:hypothetical protein